ncbi:MAG: hypothetical protein AAF798_16730 [Bacteroidota bacterium]
MEFVSEDIIEQSSTKLEADELAYANAVEDFKTIQPIVFTYLFAEGFELLTAEEEALLRFMALVIWDAVNEQHPTHQWRIITEEQIGKAEEQNWEIFNAQKGSFRKKLDIFFEDTPQEDLLAFVEDALAEDEEEEEVLLTLEARATIFISLKTLIDCLT